MERPFLVVTFAFAACVLSLSCASNRANTWGELEGGSDDRPIAAPNTATFSASRNADGAVTTPSSFASPGVRIDRALQRFTGDRALARGQAKTSSVWMYAWRDVLTEISAACEQPPRASDLGAFVRARATLDVELDTDRRRGVLLPDDLDDRVRTVLLAVDESVGELRAANAPGTMKSAPRMDGELVLRAPVVPMIVSSAFGVRTDPITGQRRFHAGTDLDAPLGSTVYAAASGLVVYAGLDGGYGKHVVVDHGDAVRTHYSHLSSIMVELGQVLEEGDAIGLVGSTGRSTGPHLHFAVTNDEGEFLDPVGLIDVPFNTIAAQVKTSGKGRANHENQKLELKLGSNRSVEIVKGAD